MVIRELKNQAREHLAQAPRSPRTVVLIYAAVALGLPLLAQLISWVLDLQISDTSGLAGIGTRSIFMSMQLILSSGIMLLAPFWNYGYMRVALQTARGEETRPEVLLSGFRRVWPLVRFLILTTVLYGFLSYTCITTASLLYAMTPHSAAVMAQFDEQALMEMLETGVMESELLLSFGKAIWPSYLLMGLLLALVIGFVSYRLRLADWNIMDGNKRVLYAFARSTFSMRGNCFRLLLLDLSFWWYYLLSVLPSLLSGVGEQIPGGGDLAFWGFYLLGTALQFGVMLLFMPYVQTTYALAYDALLKDPMGDRKPPEQE